MINIPSALKAVLILLLLSKNLSAQTLFWSDDFEDTGSPSSGTRTPSVTVACGGPPYTAYFTRVGTSNISTGTVYTGFSGSKFWAAEDVDKGATCVNNSVSSHQNITWTSINIAGKTGLSIKGLFAVGTTTAFDGFGSIQSGGTSFFDYMIVQYKIDAGTWTDLFRFFPTINNAGNGSLGLETTGDSIAQGEGQALTTIATEFSKNIVGTGTTLSLQVKLYSNSAAEEILIDNLRLFETVCSNPVISAQPVSRQVCTGTGTTMAVTATGASSYQWQVNTGAGFADITNGGVYSNATTASLTISSTTSGMNGYTYRCIAANGTCVTNSNAASLTISTPVITSASQTNVFCEGSSTGAASVNAATGGIAPYTYNWTPGNPSGDGTISVTGLTAGTWICTVTDNINCTSSRSFTITEPSVPAGTGTYSLPTVNQTVTSSVNKYNYNPGTCELLTALSASGSNPVSGVVTHKVWIEPAVFTDGGKSFVQRHYEITPVTNSTTATGTITLYFTQAEFDLFNAHPSSAMNLPAGPSDALGKSSLRVGKYSGTSGNNTGFPSSYSSSLVVIDPDDADIVWNATAAVWEVSFSVEGFSGFVVGTISSGLPVKLSSFEVIKTGRAAQISWITAEEKHSSDFWIQHSLDGSAWKTLTRVAAAGNSSIEQTYSWIHSKPDAGANYYRIVMNDEDGQQTITSVKLLRFDTEVVNASLLTNIIRNGVVQITIHTDSELVSLYNSQGQQTFSRRLGAGQHHIDVTSYKKGIYWLKFSSATEKIVIQ